jgi:hypothetical protein
MHLLTSNKTSYMTGITSIFFTCSPHIKDLIESVIDTISQYSVPNAPMYHHKEGLDVSGYQDCSEALVEISLETNE